MILETKRLALREMTQDDFSDLCEILCDPEVMYAYAHAFSKREAQEWLDRQIERYHTYGVGLWAIIRKRDGELVGQCGITRQMVEEEAVWEIGYLMKKKYWHRGYASEAARACKQYAFNVLKSDRIYSIIRDTNTASRHVAMSNGMKEVGHITKHYYDMEMPHVVYMAENIKKPVEKTWHIYLDGEFDAVRINHRFHQMVVSIGAVRTDANGTCIDTFYDTVYPRGFQRLTHIVRRMTKLQDETIRTSRRLDEVMKDFCDWIHACDPDHAHTAFYSFGPDDKRTILKHCNLEGVEMYGVLSEVIDLQKVISAGVQYQERILSPTLSLDDLKAIYHIDGDVEHNALTDARDLMLLHQAFLRKDAQDEKSILTIVERKNRTQMEARIKQQKHFCRIMQERFGNEVRKVDILYYPEVLDQLRNWEMRDEHFRMHFKKDHMIFEQQKYAYDKMKLWLTINTQEEFPSVTLSMQYEGVQHDYKYLLDYRNATPIENIMKRCGKGTE